jgi:hypothetical protein
LLDSYYALIFRQAIVPLADLLKPQARYNLAKPKEIFMNWIILVSLLFFAINMCPYALGQNYNYSYGNSRVINQSSNGLAYPSGTYIGTGTMSKSAQGVIQYGAQVNPGLPKVNRGAYIGTPGDNLYTMTPILAQDKKQIKTQHAGKFTYKQPPPKILDTYIPDPNIPKNYADFKTEPDRQSERNVVNTTGDAPSPTSKYTSSP